MTRHLGVTTMVLLLAACGGGGEADESGEVAEVTASCEVPLAGQCTTITTAQTTWDSMGGAVAWAGQCAAGASGYPGSVVADCGTADRVGRCVVNYSSGAFTAVAVYGYYAASFTAEQAGQACALLHGTFTGG